MANRRSILAATRHAYWKHDGLGTSLPAVDVDEVQEFGAGTRVFAEQPQHLAGDHRHAAFVHAARGHALVRRVDHYPDAAWLQHFADAGRDLGGEFFLYLESDRKSTRLNSSHMSISYAVFCL